jgi:dTDP-4-dehydrorhamnose reductase
MIRILLLGKDGQLGWELQRCLAPLGEVIALDYPEIDLAQPEGIREIAAAARPQVIVNATAYTAVDRAESEPELAFAINARAPEVLAETAEELGAALVHYSTDYVFDGTKGSAYVEDDPTHPLGVYGQSKLEGERAVRAAGGSYWIFRTSWVYSLRRDSFVTKVLGWARQNPTLKVVADQVGSPTWARLLAEITAQLLAQAGAAPAGWVRERSGLYHLAGDGCASRMQWAQAILDLDPRKEEQQASELLPALTADFPTPAQRPLYTALDCSLFARTFDLRLPPWQEALRLAMESV